jgi:hypothetical protein
MSGESPAESPLAVIGDFSGAATADLFALLSDETRLSTLLALWSAPDPPLDGRASGADDAVLSFTALRDRVGVGHGGRFNYHLDRMVGTVIDRTQDGYRLSAVGAELARAVVALSGVEEPFESAALDLPCPLCGGSTAVTYRHGRAYRECRSCDGHHAADANLPGGALLWAPATPAVLRERRPWRAFAALRTKLHHDHALRVAGVCPTCAGPVEHRLELCDAHRPPQDGPCQACGRTFDPAVRFVCTACKHWTTTSVTEVAMCHPAVGAFAWDHDVAPGYDADDTARWVEVLVDHDQTVRAHSPPRVEVTLAYDGDELALTFGPDLSVLAVRGGA